jgi:hypothetical protein
MNNRLQLHLVVWSQPFVIQAADKVEDVSQTSHLDSRPFDVPHLPSLPSMLSKLNLNSLHPNIIMAGRSTSNVTDTDGIHRYPENACQWDGLPREPQTSINGGTFVGGNVNHIEHRGEPGEFSLDLLCRLRDDHLRPTYSAACRSWRCIP